MLRLALGLSVGAGLDNPDLLSLDLPFAITKSLTAAKGPTPDFVRASTGTYFGSDGYLKSAANHVARFDHETSYAKSTILVQCIDCIDVYSNVFSAAERIPLSGIDVDKYPYFIGSLFTVGYSISTSQWILSYDAGNFESYSTTALGDSYTPFGAIGGSSTVTVELACKGLLIEESSANLLIKSEEFNDASWLKQLTPPVSVVANVTTAPSGSSTADILIPSTTASNFHYVSRQALTLANTSHTATVYAKAGGYNFIELIIGSTSSYTKFAAAYFNLATGQFVSSGNITYTAASYSIVSVGNGWYRCSLTVVTDANSTGIFTITCGSTSSPTASFAGNGTSGIFLWGAQLEAKAFPTSYIPTTSGTAPRSADLCELTRPAFTSFYNQPAGTIIVDGYSSNGSQPRFTSFGPTLQRTFELFTTASNLSYYNGTDVLIKSAATFPSKFGVAMTSNDAQGVFNGVLGGVNTAFSMKNPNSMTIGTYFDYSFPLNGCIRSIKYYKKRLTNAKLQSLTT